MKRVRQKDPTGCGIACVATIVKNSDKEVGYKKVKEIGLRMFPGWNETPKNFRTWPKDLRKLLSAFKIKSGKMREVSNHSSLPDTAVVAINYKFGKDGKEDKWHWVVFRREGELEYVLDPQSKRKIRRDFKCMNKNMRFCIPVSL